MNKKFQIFTTIIIILILILSFVGYTYYKDADALSKVRLEINDIDFISPSLTDVTLAFSVKFINPSDTNINNLESTFDLFIESNYIGEGNFSNIDIKSNSNTTEQIKVKIIYSGLVHSVVDIILNFISGQSSSLRISGNLKSDAVFGLNKISESFVLTHP
jgi:LEA14-like dessication related protein